MNNNIFKESEEEPSEEQQILTYVENEDGFKANLLIKQDLLSRVKKTNLKIKKENIFNVPSKLSILNPLKRKNEIFYFISTEEMSVDIKDTIGSVYLPLLTKDQITRNLKKYSNEYTIKNKNGPYWSSKDFNKISIPSWNKLTNKNGLNR